MVGWLVGQAESTDEMKLLLVAAGADAGADGVPMKPNCYIQTARGAATKATTYSLLTMYVCWPVYVECIL